jgi:hypothetical protein
MGKRASLLAVVATLCLAGPAAASLPAAGNFAGTTSAHGMNGFHDLVTFLATSGGRTLKQFQFGTLGCMSTGDYPLGVDPYAQSDTLGTISKVPVAATGAIELTTKPSFPDAGNVVTLVTVKATFTTAKTVDGTIAVKQSENGTTCNAPTMKFTAVPGTPQSLGYEGP